VPISVDLSSANFIVYDSFLNGGNRPSIHVGMGGDNAARSCDIPVNSPANSLRHDTFVAK